MFNSTKAKTPAEYLKIIPKARQQEIADLNKLIQKVTGLKPFILTGMLAYGPFHYKYASGREGDWCAIALASQKNYISLYVCMTEKNQYIAELYKKKLPKASIGKSCIRFKKLTDVDQKVITEILKHTMKVYRKVTK